MTREIWTGNYEKALPISVQDFDLTGVLPAIFYMFRFGHRRGKGKFLETFGGDSGTPKERRRAATIERVAATLAADCRSSKVSTARPNRPSWAISCCASVWRTPSARSGRNEQVQRVAPAHYMASWVDLPDSVAHLRYVPEMIVAMLADQRGRLRRAEPGRRPHLVCRRPGFEDNVLLKRSIRGWCARGRSAVARPIAFGKRKHGRSGPAPDDPAGAATGSGARQAARRRRRTDFESASDRRAGGPSISPRTSAASFAPTRA